MSFAMLRQIFAIRALLIDMFNVIQDGQMNYSILYHEFLWPMQRAVDCIPGVDFSASSWDSGSLVRFGDIVIATTSGHTIEWESITFRVGSAMLQINAQEGSGSVSLLDLHNSTGILFWECQGGTL